MAARLSFMLFLLEEAHKEDNLERKRQARLIRSLPLLNTHKSFVDIYRLSEELIIDLERDLTPLLPKQKRQGGLSNRTKILCALGFLSSGSYQKVIGESVKTYVSQTSVSRTIRTVVDALSHPTIVKKYIRFPLNSHERQVLRERFYEKFKIPGVIGCVDGCLVAMIRPQQHEERFYCRKGYHARNALIINDPDLNILHVDATFGGATHDSFIFNSCSIKTHLEQLSNTGETAILLGDSAFALRPYMMVPYNNAVPGSKEEYYNKLQSTARNTAERTYGILKGRFRCLLVHRVLHYDPDMVAKIIIACSVLHNICNHAGLPPVELPAHLQRSEDRVLRLLRANQTRPIHSLENGRVSRERLINILWRSRLGQ